MEKYIMFMDQKNQYSENEFITQSNLQIQCNPYQSPNGIFQRTTPRLLGWLTNSERKALKCVKDIPLHCMYS